MQFKPFIFNWPQQLDRVRKLESQFLQLAETFPELLAPTVVNSDVENYVPHWISVGNHYFATQLKTAIDHLPPDTALLHIQGDVSFPDWEPLIDRLLEANERFRWGVIAPNVTKIYWNHEGNLEELEGGFTEVLHTDCTVWAIHPETLKELSAQCPGIWKNAIGWGLDTAILSVSRSQGRRVVRDYTHTVRHHGDTNYPTDTALTQYLEMVSKLPPAIRKHVRWLSELQHQRFGTYL